MQSYFFSNIVQLYALSFLNVYKLILIFLINDKFLPANDIDAAWQALQRSAARANLATIQVVDVLGFSGFVAVGTDTVSFDESRDGEAGALGHDHFQTTTLNLFCV